jgi:hypothetical protein
MLKAQVLNSLKTTEVPQSYKSEVKWLEVVTLENTQNTDVENWGYVVVWAGWHLF